MCGFLKCLIDQIDRIVISKKINARIKISIFKNDILINLKTNNLYDIFFLEIWWPGTESNRQNKPF